MAQIRSQKKEIEALTKQVQEARDIAEQERTEKAEMLEANQELVKKVMALSLSKVSLLKRLESSEDDREAAEQDVFENMIKSMGSLKGMTIGGIPWSDLKQKRSDPSFDHMRFWESLTKDEKETLMALLKKEKEQTQKSD